jgi:cardiolipin synthase
LTLANWFTIGRMALIPIFGALWTTGRPLPALGVFGLALATDGIDGFIARRFHQQSRLGALLDPAADKLLMVASFLVGASTRTLPAWLAAVVIGRDLALVSGAVLFAFILPGRHDPHEWRPSRLGKYAMFAQSMVVAMALCEQGLRLAGLRRYLEVLMLAAATLTLVSAVQYFTRAAVAFARAPRRPEQGA